MMSIDLEDLSNYDFLMNEKFKLNVTSNNKNYELLLYLKFFVKHPCVEFDEIDSQHSYNDIFNHSSLAITDFSSVIFDFAYLKKPVIYYHAVKDYHFNIEESYFDYETMGFGEIAKDHDTLVKLIKEYVTSNCQMKEEYKKRVDDFFEFRDKNNCRRVYNFISNN